MRPCLGKNDRALRALTEPGKKGPMEEGAAAAGQGPWPASLPPDPRPDGPTPTLGRRATRGGGDAARLVERARPARRGLPLPRQRPARRALPLPRPQPAQLGRPLWRQAIRGSGYPSRSQAGDPSRGQQVEPGRGQPEQSSTEVR